MNLTREQIEGWKMNNGEMSPNQFRALCDLALASFAVSSERHTFDENGACERLRLAMLFIEEWANWWAYGLGLDDSKPLSAEETAAGEKMAESFGARARDMVIMNRRFLASEPSVRSATPATVKAALVAARGDILQAWADRCGIDVTDERVQEANKVGWPHDYGLFEAGWNALARALISRADRTATDG